MTAIPSDPQDRPAESWRRFVTDAEARAAAPEFSLGDPVVVGQMFCNALDDHVEFLPALGKLVVPQTRAGWGDFSAAAAFLASINDRGFASVAERAVGVDDVAYCKIFRDVPTSYQVTESQVLFAAAIITLVRQTDTGVWRVYSLGREYVRPEDIASRE